MKLVYTFFNNTSKKTPRIQMTKLIKHFTKVNIGNWGGGGWEEVLTKEQKPANACSRKIESVI